jgi:hypothetical protein
MTNQLVRRRLHPFHHVSSISLSSKVFLWKTPSHDPCTD